MTIPYKNSDKTKKEQIAGMFNNIAHKYDFLNRVLSVGIDTIWRKKTMRKMKKHNPQHILDVATGTADFAIVAAQKLSPASVVGIDISENMLEYGRKKIKKKHLESIIRLELADSENLHFADNSFDACTTGFGVRNFENLSQGLQEIARVLKPQATAYILEFSMPTAFPIKQLYKAYFKYILPIVGRILSKDTSAYTYLYDSVQHFPQRQAFADIALQAGFAEVTFLSMSFGIVTLYECTK